MKIMQTLEGGLRIDAEDEGDWQLLMGITHDALSCEEKLGDRLGGLMHDEQVARDWKEFIVPDLNEAFHTELTQVATAISAARVDSGGGPGPLWITPDDAFPWYSALNQARLAIEERFHFGPSEDIDPFALPVEARAAFLRSMFYCNIQSLLLERVLR